MEIFVIYLEQKNFPFLFRLKMIEHRDALINSVKITWNRVSTRSISTEYGVEKEEKNERSFPSLVQFPA